MNIFNKAQKDVSSQATKTEKSVHTLDDAFRMISPSTLSAVAGVTALIGTMKSLVGVGKNIINVTSQFEQTQKALETVTQSAEKGKKLFEDLRKFSFDTTFGVDELANASSQLLNVGVSSSVLQKDLKMLGDLAQGDKVKFQELTSIFSKIQSTGKASSMQLQQLALRGIPIQKTLKEMEVTGTTSAEKLTEAFEKLTGVGGQFHDAMNNIIDTIEGKMGFITDTIKEINVNFGELTGITDGYKKSLDFVYDILDAVNNKLMEWNENPMIKAIIRGTLVAGVTALAVAIGVGLVGAIKTLNKNLAITATLKAMINPTAMALSVGIGAITGLAVALETAKASANEYLNEIKEVDALADKYGVKDVKMAKARKAVNKGNATTEQKLAVAVEDLKSSKLFEKQFQMQYNEGNEDARYDLIEQQGITKELQKQVDELFEVMQLEEKRKNSQKSIKQLYQEQQDAFGEFTKSLGNVYQEYSEVAKVEKELETISEKRAELESKISKVYHGFDEKGVAITLNLSEEEKAKFDKDVEVLIKKERELKIKLAVDKQEDWQKKLQSAFGFTSTEVFKGATATTTGALKYFEQMWKSQQDLYKKYGIEGSKYDSKEEYAKAIRSAFDAVLESVREGTYSGDESSLVTFANAVKEAENAVNGLTDKVEVSITSLSDLSTYLMKIATGKDANGNFLNSKGDRIDAMVGAMAISGAQGSKAGDIANGAMQGASVGGVFGAIIGALVALAMKTQTFTDALEDLNGIIDPLVKAVNAILKPITSLAKIIIDVLNPILVWLANGIETVFDFLFGWLTKYADSQREATRAKQKELELMNQMREAYKNLYDAMKENEEYYLKRKLQLNAESYKQNVVRQVNDMILTDKGVFSTSPQDTIMAMKHPESLLGGGKTEVNVQVIDYVGVNGNIRQEGNNIFIELLSQKIASDYADGSNGWATAVAVQQQSSMGRSFSR